MKKLIASLGMIVGLFLINQKASAVVPTEQMSQTRTAYIVAPGTNPPSAVTYPIAPDYNTVISVSSSSASNGGAVQVVLAVVQTTVTYNFGVTTSTYTGRNCLTDASIIVSSSSTFNLLDGGTTDYSIPGPALVAFSGGNSNHWEKHWDHRGPWCGTAGNTITLNITSSGSQAINTINAEGYTIYTGLTSPFNVGQ